MEEKNADMPHAQFALAKMARPEAEGVNAPSFELPDVFGRSHSFLETEEGTVLLDIPDPGLNNAEKA